MLSIIDDSISFLIEKIYFSAHSVPPLSHLTSFAATESNLSFVDSLATVFPELSIPNCVGHSKESIQV
jgi:hypothetical protein